MNEDPRLPARWQIFLTVSALLGAGLFLAYKCLFSPGVLFLMPDSRMPWIRHPEFFAIKWIRPEQPPPAAVYLKNFDAPAGARVRVSAKALRGLSLYINETRADLGPAEHRDWRRPFEADISGYLREGNNVLRAEVTNANGPALLAMRLEGLGRPLVTDGSWQVRTETDAFVPAVPAADERSGFDPELTLPRSPEYLKKGWPVLLFLFAASAAAFHAGSVFLRRLTARDLLFITAVVLAGAWLYFFFEKCLRVPALIGFDIRRHLKVIETVFYEHRLPLPVMPRDEIASQHPPLFYLLGALVMNFFSAYSQVRWLRIISFLSGAGHIALVWAAARRIFKEDPPGILFAVAAAGLIPMNIYMSAYISNEALHGFLAGAAVLMTLRILGEKETRLRDCAALGLFLGLALLTKLTVLLLIPVVAIFAALKLFICERLPPARAAARLGAAAAVFLAVAGPYFLWVYASLGRFIPEQGTNVSFWQSPGYHLAGYYFRFGESFTWPWLSNVDSFWDGLYTTFWGDGYIGGSPNVLHWNYQFMAAGYWLAVPATLLMAAGGWLALRRWFGDASPERRLMYGFLLAVVFLAGFLMVYTTLVSSSWTLPKAFYALFALIPLSVFFASGLRAAHDFLSVPGRLVPRLIFYGWLGTFAAVIYLSYLTSSSPLPPA